MRRFAAVFVSVVALAAGFTLVRGSAEAQTRYEKAELVDMCFKCTGEACPGGWCCKITENEQ